MGYLKLCAALAVGLFAFASFVPMMTYDVGAAEPGDVFDDNGVVYEITSVEDGARTASVIQNYSGYYSGELIIPSVAYFEETAYSVIAVKDGAFKNCTQLVEVSLPDSITTFGTEVFSGCSHLTFVELPERMTTVTDSMFNGCARLASITIPGGVTMIGANAFSQSGLTSITVSDSVTEIGDSAFQSCGSLRVATIGKNVSTIGDYAFNGCESLYEVSLLSQVSHIYVGVEAFPLDVALREEFDNGEQLAGWYIDGSKVESIPSDNPEELDVEARYVIGGNIDIVVIIGIILAAIIIRHLFVTRNKA